MRIDPVCSSSKKPKSEFLCDLQFTNHLPDIPFEPKLLKIHLPPQRSVKGAHAGVGMTRGPPR